MAVQTIRLAALRCGSRKIIVMNIIRQTRTILFFTALQCFVSPGAISAPIFDLNTSNVTVPADSEAVEIMLNEGTGRFLGKSLEIFPSSRDTLNRFLVFSEPRMLPSPDRYRAEEMDAESPRELGLGALGCATGAMHSNHLGTALLGSRPCSALSHTPCSKQGRS